MKAPTLETDRLVLIPLSMDHVSENYVNWMNDPRVIRYLESGGDYTIEKLKAYLTSVVQSEILFWAIHKKSDRKHIGNIKIDPINLKHGLGEYGILMGDRAEWGRGYAKEASKAVIDYCFFKVNLRKITLGVVAENSPAVELYKKLNFRIEGLLKEHQYYEGNLCDILRMALFNTNYQHV